MTMSIKECRFLVIRNLQEESSTKYDVLAQVIDGGYEVSLRISHPAKEVGCRQGTNITPIYNLGKNVIFVDDSPGKFRITKNLHSFIDIDISTFNFVYL
jgi:uncharacterized protein YfbU (UPF0304 family)